MGELDNQVKNKNQGPVFRFREAEDIRVEGNTVADLMRDDNEYVFGSRMKLSLDEHIEEPPEENDIQKDESRIKNFRLVNPLTEAYKYSGIQTESDLRRDQALSAYRKSAAYMLKDKNVTEELKTLLEDVQTYLSVDYDALSMDKREAKGKYDGKYGIFWLWNSFTHKMRFSRKTQSEKLIYLKKKIEALPDDKTEPVKFLKAWIARMTTTALDPKEEEINDATKVKFKRTKDGKENKMEMADRRGEPLFAQEPSVRDIVQGSLGDCYFLANLAGLVSRDPDAIRNMMRDEGDTVTVRFYSKVKKVGRIDIEPVYIRVDKRLPQNFASHSLWVQVLEKAFTVYYGISKKLNKVAEIKLDKDLGEQTVDYDDISGGYLEDAFLMLTGQETEINASVSNVTTNRIENLFEALPMNYVTAPEYLKKARSLPITARKIKDEYNKKIEKVCEEIGVDLKIFNEYKEMQMKKVEFMRSGVDEDSENKELANEYIKVENFLKKHQRKFQEDNIKLDQNQDYQDLYRQMQEELFKAAQEMEDQLNKGGFSLGGSDPLTMDSYQQEKTQKIHYYDHEGDMKLYELSSYNEKNETDPLKILKNKQSFKGRSRRICKSLLAEAAKRAGVADIHGVLVMPEKKKKKKKGEAPEEGWTEYTRTASIEDYQEVIAKLRAYIEREDTTFTLKDAGEGELSYSKEALKSGDINKVFKEILLKSLTYIENSFEYQTLITHRPLSGKYTKAAKIKYKEIEDAIAAGRVVTFGTKHNSRTNRDGLNKESYFEGMYDSHAYTIFGVKKLGDRLFIRARNPWGRDMVKYVEGENGAIKYDHEEGYERDGIGLIEFNHFLSRSDGYYIQK
ncbi:MAG: hypothetical protein J6O71_04825 [Lachnospiraceae bacterium]|nr:hypothetical protein [Lachnospiraceae bacterium]